MSEEAVRQTRSQKRALERDVVAPGSPGGELDIKKVKLENCEQPPAADGPIALVAVGGGDVVKTEQAAKVASMSILKTDEVKATIKVEVQTGDGPVDMSTSKSDLKKERQPLSPNNEVIVLSDNEPSSPVMNGLNHFRKTDTDLLMKSRPDERECIIKQLMEELRLQEAKLVLLKKLRQSQTQKESTVQKPTSGSVATPPPLVRGSMTSGKGVLQVSSVRSSGTVIPPPLVRGGQHVPSKQNSQATMPPLVRGAQVTYTLPIAVSPQQIASLRQQQQQHSGSGPPPLLLAPRASVPNVQVQGQRIIQQGLIRVANVPNTNVLVNIPQGSQKGSSVTSQAGMGSSVSTVQANESPAARQAAAKLALRKQLEKTLLDIPPPKPPAPEFNFLPSAANNEFIYLVGLEEVVQNLLDTLGRGKQQGQSVAPETPVPKEPHTCAQCKTDFTSRWRSEKSGPVLCDHCMSSNLKKALKAEHTNRLKAAFVKALQQEQEIEQRILHQAASPVSKTPSSSGMKSEHQQHVLVSQQYKQARAQLQQQHRGTPVARHHSSIKQSPGQLSRSVQQAVGSRSVSHSFPTSSQQLQNAVTAAALASRPGKHAMRPAQGTKGSSSNPSANPNAWRKQTTGNSGLTMAYVNPSLSVNKTTTSANLERQREYLLDMIPSRSISQTANTWK
ncbi:transcriptional repressor p66-alpha isoform X1 [Salmo salar]|uniref:Transcriptional repressor p66-alpha isoform X1 n=1 Tax=Salmo salar TaxID=8030 RepID=A0A1S3T5A3_SALSA|nr:transcriptional repressor p66-alpha isoform X1 [Salmo salar]|eukprot:XP_014071767.1 PREDICTED: transcriptional repressor p66-alpha-like isoform X1 [Salmo salar]